MCSIALKVVLITPGISNQCSDIISSLEMIILQVEICIILLVLQNVPLFAQMNGSIRIQHGLQIRQWTYLVVKYIKLIRFRCQIIHIINKHVVQLTCD